MDRLILGTRHIWQATRVYDPEGILSTLPATATTLLGVLAGHWLRAGQSGARPAARIVGGLAAAGLAATALGWLWGLSFPVNKPLWTSSYALLMAGLAALVLAACHWAIEVRGRRGWAGPFAVLGVHALTLFFLSSLMAKLLFIVRVGRGRPAAPGVAVRARLRAVGRARQRVAGLRAGVRAAVVGAHVGARPERAAAAGLTSGGRARLTNGLPRSQKRHGRATQSSA